MKPIIVYIVTIISLLVISLVSYADVSMSKGNAYSILAPIDGRVMNSKIVGYSVFSPVGGMVSNSKTIAYVVVAPPAKRNQPIINIFTRDIRTNFSNGQRYCFKEESRQ